MSDTDDPALAQAEADLKRIDEVIERSTKERDEIVAFIRRHKMYAPPKSRRESAPKPGKNETLIDAIEAVLRASTAPMLVPDIVASVKARGKRMNSDDPARLVSSIMSRNDRFRYERGIGWSLA